jgi:DNA-binding response OmpR family regulator
LPHHAEAVLSSPAPADEADDVSGEGTVLVIEDDAHVRVFIERALQRAGFQTELAADGQEGLERFRELHPGLVAVIVDYMMPRMKGDEVAAEIRRVNRTLPVLMMSGFSEIDVRNRAVASAATDFIQKPFRAGNLTGKLRAAIGVRRTS